MTILPVLVRACPNCGSTLEGRFGAHCGQKAAPVNPIVVVARLVLGAARRHLRHTLVGVLVVLAGAMIVIAQQKPDFTGEWVLNLKASALSPAVAAAAQSGVLGIEHHDPSFTSHLTVMFGAKPFETRFELLADGREVVETVRERRSVSSLRWDGDALVFMGRSEGPDGAVTISFRYELQDGGRRLRAAEQIRGGGRDQDNLWVFERR
jgi:hypothetical protein